MDIFRCTRNYLQVASRSSYKLCHREVILECGLTWQPQTYHGLLAVVGIFYTVGPPVYRVWRWIVRPSAAGVGHQVFTPHTFNWRISCSVLYCSNARVRVRCVGICCYVSTLLVALLEGVVVKCNRISCMREIRLVVDCISQFIAYYQHHVVQVTWCHVLLLHVAQSFHVLCRACMMKELLHWRWTSVRCSTIS